MNARSFDEQENVELLLPWHAAGTLGRRDAARVDQALAADRELSRRFELVREELGEAVLLNESLGAPSSRAMQRLFSKIDAEPVRHPPVSARAGGWWSNFVASLSPRTLAYSGTVAALVIVLQGSMLTSLLLQDQPVTGQPKLSSVTMEESTRSIELNPGSFVFVRFNPDASAAEITRFLDGNRFTIVGGPNQGSGLFRILVSDKSLNSVELNAVVTRMSQDRKVVAFTVPAAKP